MKSMKKSSRLAGLVALLIAIVMMNPCSVFAAGTLVWAPAGGVQYAATERTDTVSMAMDSGGAPYIAYVYYDLGYKWVVKKYNGSGWTQVGTTGSPVGYPANLQFKLAPDDTLYVAYNNNSNSFKATVEKFNGTSWENVGNADFSAGRAEYMSFAIGDNGTPYVVYRDGANGNKLTVMKFDSTTGWVTVGSPGFSTDVVYTTSIAIDSTGKPYVAYGNGGNKDYVMTYDGSSWVQVGGTFSASSIYQPYITIANNNTVYLAYTLYDYFPSKSKYLNVLYVKSYSSTDTEWVAVGDLSSSSGAVYASCITTDSNNIPYLLSKDSSNNLNVMKYDTTGLSWGYVGNQSFSSASAYYGSIVTDSSNTPYVMYQDGDNGNAVVVYTTVPGYNLSYTANGNGSISSNASQAVPSGGNGTAVTAVPNTGYHFVNWNDGSTANPRTDSNVTSDISVTASFAINTYNLSYTAGSNGTLSGTTVQTVNHGDSGTEVIAEPDTNYHFVNWSDDSTANPRTDSSVTSNIDVSANFSPDIFANTYHLNGGANNAANAASYTYGVGLTLEAPTKEGYTFEGWYEQSDFSGSAVTAINTTDTGDKTFYVKWTANSYDITYHLNDGTNNASNVASYTCGVGLTLGAPTKTGYTFAGWYEQSDFSGSAVTVISTTDTGDKTFYAKWTANSYNIAYHLNDGTNNASNAASYTCGVGLTLGAPTKTGYTFAGWYEQSNFTGSAVTAISTTDIGDKTFYAKWTANSSASGSGSTSTPAPTPTPEAPKTEVTVSGNNITATAKTSAASDSNGKAIAGVTQAQVSDAIGKAVLETAKHGKDAAVTVEIKVTASAGAKAVETSIPKASVSEMANNNEVDLKVSTPVGDITFSKNALDAISQASSEAVRITAAKADASVLSDETKQIVGDKPVYNFSVISGNNSISQFGGNVTVSVPYTPKSGEDTNAIIIYYINAEGKLETVSNSHYDPTTGKVTFTTNHFSRYAVGYNKVTFKDVPADAWYGNAVGFIAARGITTGTGNGSYNPEEKLTRADFLVMMMRAYGISPDTSSADNFSDAGNTYYTGYLAAAKRLGISTGVGSNKFAPGLEITRQEMFTLLYNTMKIIGKLPGGGSEKALSDFIDAGQVASWAKDAMTLFAETGTINGSGGKLAPEDTTTRAQMAQVLYNLLSK